MPSIAQASLASLVGPLLVAAVAWVIAVWLLRSRIKGAADQAHERAPVIRPKP